MSTKAKPKATNRKASRRRSAPQRKHRERAATKLTARLIRIGNSRGIRLPKTVIEQAGLGEEIEVVVKYDEVILRSPSARQSKRNPREGWEEQIKAALVEHGDDIDEWREWQAIPNEFDKEEWTW